MQNMYQKQGGKLPATDFWHLTTAPDIHEPQYIVLTLVQENSYVVKYCLVV